MDLGLRFHTILVGMNAISFCSVYKLASKVIRWGPSCYVFRPCVNVPNLLSNVVIFKPTG